MPLHLNPARPEMLLRIPEGDAMPQVGRSEKSNAW
jgi:hypothetical protein